jgi:hypothetical protein
MGSPMLLMLEEALVPRLLLAAAVLAILGT